MYTDRTKAYFEAYKSHRAGLAAIWETFDKAMKAIEPYKGSAGYDKDKAALEKSRDDAITEHNKEYGAKFTDILNGMEESVEKVALKAPTADMLAILQTLSMRQKVERGELRQAARALRDNPLALSALDEIAVKHNMGGVRGEFGGETPTSVNRHIKALRNSASQIMALRRPNSRREMAANAQNEVRNTGSGISALKGFMADRDFETEAEALEYFGGVSVSYGGGDSPTFDLDSFRGYVNND